MKFSHLSSWCALQSINKHTRSWSRAYHRKFLLRIRKKRFDSLPWQLMTCRRIHAATEKRGFTELRARMDPRRQHYETFFFHRPPSLSLMIV
jgi:hypothetical protein